MPEMKIAAANMQVTGEKTENLASILRMVAKCKDLGVDVAVFPELALNGYPNLDIPIGSESAAEQHRRYVLGAESLDGRSIGDLVRALNKTTMAIQIGFVETDAIRGVLYNTVAILSAEGVIGTYRKIHNALEFPYFAEGHETPTFDVLGVRAASLICFDIMIPELARTYALKGAELLLVSTAWPRSSWSAMAELSAGRQERAMSLAAEANALFNQIWVVVSNQCGRSASGVEYAGNSQIVGPSGECLARTDDGEGFAIASIDVAEGILDARVRGFHIMGARRPECYAELAGKGSLGPEIV
jgi:predicted amidohydrolase